MYPNIVPDSIALALRREEPLTEKAPETVLSHSERGDPEQEALLADSVGLALLVVLENLNPAERISFVLHDVFALTYEEIAPIVDRTQEATRQLASRARRRVKGMDTVKDADIARQRKVVDAFLEASRTGDFEALLSVLDPDVVLRDDRDTETIGVFKVLRGARNVAGQLSERAQAARPALVDGSVGVVVAPRGRLLFVLQLSITDSSQIAEIEVVTDPKRVGRLNLALV
jgi:hypothetical protein